MTDTIKQVKVDNWGDFFLRNLQALYTRGDYCDLTLQFHTNECIKVHRLVLKACTEYFESLLKQNNVTDHMRLPPNLNSDVVVPIINFMYSGLLEFRPELVTRLYNTAKILKMNILTSLLDTHVGPIPSTNLPAPNIEPSVVSMVTTPSKNSPSVRHQPSPTYPVSPQTATATAMLQPLPSSSVDETPHPPKKLSIWKKRTTPVNSSSHSNSFVTVIPHRTVVDEPAKPTRFEWPEEDTETMPLLYSSTFDDISYDSAPIVKSINNMVKAKVSSSPSTGLVVMPQQRVMPVATFESVYQSANLKRPTASQPPSTSAAAQPPLKKPKVVDMNDVKEFMQEQEVRKGLITQDDPETDDLDDFLPPAGNDSCEDDTNPEGGLGQLSQSAAKQGTPKPILKVSEVTTPDLNVNKEPAKCAGSSKKVRFSSENKVTLISNASKPGGAPSPINSLPAPAGTPTGPTKATNPVTSQNQQIIMDGNTAMRISTTKPDGTPQTPKPNSNHAKIIAEVLKKYPHLVKHNKNIRLKIMQRDGPASPGGEQADIKSKVSYMVVKADSCMKSDDSKGNDTAKPAPTGVDNITGPWLCYACGVDSEPVNLPSYYTYYKHLQEIHNEKIDARICEFCGYRANKRNLLLYHLLTKHNKQPPSNYAFPKCGECDYYALSDSLLLKHKNIHDKDKELFTCKVCKAGFKTGTALQGHIQMKSHWAGSNQRAYRCPVCNKSFSSHSIMKSHVEVCHKDVAVSIQDEEEDNPVAVGQQPPPQPPQPPQPAQQPQPPAERTQEFVQTPAQQNQEMPLQQEQQHLLAQHQEVQMITQQEHQEQHTTYILPDVSLLDQSQQGTLLQSTEAESLSNVASGIAASLGVSDSMIVVEQQPQTVLYLDKNQLIQLQASGNVHGVPGSSHVQEYIVPEIMASDLSQGVNVYTAGQLSQIVQYTTGSLQTNEQGILTIVNPNGTISQATPLVQQHEILQHLPVSHQDAVSVENMPVVISDHDYAEEVAIQQNGNVSEVINGSQSVEVAETISGTQNIGDSVNVPQLSIVNTVPVLEPERTTQRSEVEIPKLVREMGSEQSKPKVEGCEEDSSNPPPVLEREKPVPVEPLSRKSEGDPVSSSPHTSSTEQRVTETSEKMAALVRDWDDFDEDNEAHAEINCQPVVEEALPSRPTILLKSDMEHDDLSDNLVKIT